MSDRLVAKFYLFQVTRSVGFISPIFALFVLRDLSFTQYGTLGALYSVLVVVGEIPTGYVGDRYGQRVSLALSALLSVCSLAGFVVAQSFWPYVLFWVLWAFALTFASGSVDAWLYDVLDRYADPDEFVRIRGRGESVMGWTSVVTMILGGALYAVDPTYPFVASVVLNGLGLLVLFTLPAARRTGEEAGDDPDAADDPDGSDDHDDTERITMLDLLPLVRRRFTSGALRSFVAYTGLFFAVVSAADSYIQPVARELFEATLQSASVAGRSIPLGVVLGLLYASFTVVSATGSYFAGDIEDVLGLRWVLLVVPVVTGTLLILPRLVVLTALPMFVAIRGSNALLSPIVNGYLNEQIDSVGRATTLSAFSMLYQLVRVPLVLAAGVIADLVSETVAVAMLGGVFLLGGVLVWLVAPPVARSARGG